MKYFLIKADPIYATAPDIRNWFGVFEKRDVHVERHQKMKDRFVLKITGKKYCFYRLDQYAGAYGHREAKGCHPVV